MNVVEEISVNHFIYSLVMLSNWAQESALRHIKKQPGIEECDMRVK